MIRPSAVLLKARDILAKRGWIQGNAATLAFTDPGAPCCLGVAVQLAENELGVAEDHDLNTYTCALLTKATGTPNHVSWNDAGGRTAQEVLAALEWASDMGEQKAVRP